jgi:hypothetical protein
MEKTVKFLGTEVDVKSAGIGAAVTLVTGVVVTGAIVGIKKGWAYIKAAHKAGKQELAQTQAETKPEEMK